MGVVGCAMVRQFLCIGSVIDDLKLSNKVDYTISIEQLRACQNATHRTHWTLRRQDIKRYLNSMVQVWCMQT